MNRLLGIIALITVTLLNTPLLPSPLMVEGRTPALKVGVWGIFEMLRISKIPQNSFFPFAGGGRMPIFRTLSAPEPKSGEGDKGASLAHQ